jgi:hypothetical protein
MLRRASPGAQSQGSQAVPGNDRFRTLKLELTHGQRYGSREAMRQGVFEYIEVDYRRGRGTVPLATPARRDSRHRKPLHWVSLVHCPDQSSRPPTASMATSTQSPDSMPRGSASSGRMTMAGSCRRSERSARRLSCAWGSVFRRCRRRTASSGPRWRGDATRAGTMERPGPGTAARPSKNGRRLNDPFSPLPEMDRILPPGLPRPVPTTAPTAGGGPVRAN